VIRLRGRGVEYGEVWFDEEPERPLPDILICRQRPQPWPGATCTGFTTLTLDLSESEEALLASMTKNTRYEIRRATSDGGRFTFYDDPHAVLEDFSAFYDRFAVANGLAAINRAWLSEVASVRRLTLSCVERDGEPLVWHSYCVVRDRARLVHSASLFREMEVSDRARVGRLNRWLHWQDILEFRRCGLHVYDFGGLFEDETSAASRGIDRFKTEFGGSKRTEFECIVALSWKGRAYLPLQKLWRRIRVTSRRSTVDEGGDRKG
jgi:hypothetical protein